LGFRTLEEVIGRTDLLDKDASIQHWKSKGLDFSRLFHMPKVAREEMLHTSRQQHPIVDILDRKLIAEAAPALERGEKVVIESAIINVN
ncbi:hypothetical protein J8J27_28645, partial [Mycobacterium tuberculosis]|nr:hypothetical protein [Mycobacterium tuberculosis]